MATNLWNGDAAPVAQIDLITIASPTTNAALTVTIGDKILAVAAPTTVADDAAAAIVAAWLGLSSSAWPEFAELTPAAIGSGSGQLTVTANTAGQPFTIAVAISGSGTITHTTTTASAGPNDWNTAKNWSLGHVPESGEDIVFENSTAPVWYGLNQSAVAPASLTIKASCASPFGIGLSRTTGNAGYVQYRPTYLAIGPATLDIGGGSGNGSGRIKIDVGTANCATMIRGSGQTYDQGVPAVLIRGGGSAATIAILKGVVGIAFFAEDTATAASLTVSFTTNPGGDASVQCGAGFAVASVFQFGGSLLMASGCTTFDQEGAKATATMTGTGSITTLTAGGTFSDQSTGTITTATIRGVYDARQLVAGKAITNAVVLASGGEYHDPYARVTLSGGIRLDQCAPADVTLDLPLNRTYTFV